MAISKRKKSAQISSTEDNENTTRPEDNLDSKEQLKTEVAELKKSVNERPFFIKGRFLFPLGIFFGILLGFAFVEPEDIQTLHSHVSTLANEYDINIPQLPDIDLSRMEVEWARLKNSIPEVWKFNNDGREFQAGQTMKARGLTAQHPVILIPGIISTALESWSTTPEYRPFFREKLWGGFNMLSQVTFNKESWISSMMLDPVTGLDPPHVKVRAAEGLDAASSFVQGYWLWSKIIENLAVLNYDTNNLFLAPYDWRLSYYNLEERDGYFSKLKSIIEGLKQRQKKKVVIAAHSMGSTVILPLISISFKWVESPDHGKGGPTWVEDHIDSYISIAGTHLGVSKAMAAFLSGEMKDTVQMNPAGAYVLEQFFSRKERQRLFRSWAGSASLWMKGGDAIWGNATHAPDDECDAHHTHGELIAFREVHNGKTIARNMTTDEASIWILQHTPTTFQKMIESNYSYGFERDEEQLKRNNGDHRKWTNPLEIQLPLAPSMKMYCVYGHGKETEVKNGVKMGEGDGTVSLLSLGAMCVEGWKRRRWNPAGIKVTTVELPHRPILTIPRGGANTSDHVDILGSTRLNEIILAVAAGAGEEIQESLVSNITEYARKIQWD
ncbi:hypothetical protein CVT24_006162 [Panaeolus cyanescens]|uniref:Phospholipid:diacylglycerol acyltransferase n=1 Tax=Panaeolus cyanescens TaxID=181874 RepID=A0A409V8N0_9AGAR|nr:hypothetical protein CVT24_006162 [Panaeolus cyanescens]